MKRVAIIGTGPTGLICAELLSRKGIRVEVFEKRPGPARKLYIAGSSGLNIGHACPDEELISYYTGPKGFWKNIFAKFSTEDWLSYLKELKIETFLGTSKRYFVKEMKAGSLVTTWREAIEARGGVFHFNQEMTDMENAPSENLNDTKVRLHFNQTTTFDFDTVCIALGGGSYEESLVSWPEIFKRQGIRFNDFAPSNVGFEVEWSPEFIKETEGKPLKNVTVSKGKKILSGDLVVTRYGIEGTPIYFMGEAGEILIDLKPGLSLEECLRKVSKGTENLAPIRKIQKYLNLCPASQALIFHHSSQSEKQSLSSLVMKMKAFPVSLIRSRTLSEAISSKGGVSLEELNPNLSLKKFPQIFLGGEMLDWDAPTGGFLVQACVSQGYVIAEEIVKLLKAGP